MEKLNLIGTQTIETEHFILRAFIESDGQAMFDNWTSNPRVARYVTWDTHPSVDVSSCLCRLWEDEAKNNDNFQWAMVLKEIGEPIGSIGVVSINKEINEATIGYCMGEKWWNKGYTTECLKAIIDYLFAKVNFNRISACHHINNPASGKVMTKSGLKFEGIKRQSALDKGKLIDLAEYAILKEDWLLTKNIC